MKEVLWGIISSIQILPNKFIVAKPYLFDLIVVVYCFFFAPLSCTTWLTADVKDDSDSASERRLVALYIVQCRVSWCCGNTAVSCFPACLHAVVNSVKGKVGFPFPPVFTVANYAVKTENYQWFQSSFCRNTVSLMFSLRN